MAKRVLICFQNCVCFNGKSIIFFLAINCYFVFAQTLEKESGTSLFTTGSSFTSVPFHVTTTPTKERSLISCVFLCHIQDFPAFHYFENNETCFCSSADDSFTGEHDNIGTGIIHGIRTEKVSTSYIQVHSTVFGHIEFFVNYYNDLNDNNNCLIIFSCICRF